MLTAAWVCARLDRICLLVVPEPCVGQGIPALNSIFNAACHSRILPHGSIPPARNGLERPVAGCGAACAGVSLPGRLSMIRFPTKRSDPPVIRAIRRLPRSLSPAPESLLSVPAAPRLGAHSSAEPPGPATAAAGSHQQHHIRIVFRRICISFTTPRSVLTPRSQRGWCACHFLDRRCNSQPECQRK